MRKIFDWPTPVLAALFTGIGLLLCTPVFYLMRPAPVAVEPHPDPTPPKPPAPVAAGRPEQPPAAAGNYLLAAKQAIIARVADAAEKAVAGREETAPPRPRIPEVCLVSRVVDGDTVVLQTGQGEVKCRLIGVDTPEAVHPTKQMERYSKEASAFLKRMIEGKTVRIEYEGDGPTYDRYRRVLAYLWVDDMLVNRTIIEQGYGHAYVKYPFKRMEEFRLVEQVAREDKRGLWAPEPDTKETDVAGDDTHGKPAASREEPGDRPTKKPAASPPTRKRKRYMQYSDQYAGPGSMFPQGGSGGSPMVGSSMCGAPTRDGTPCRRLVKGGGPCYQHGG